jgi:hypothetical protein
VGSQYDKKKLNGLEDRTRFDGSVFQNLFKNMVQNDEFAKWQVLKYSLTLQALPDSFWK